MVAAGPNSEKSPKWEVPKIQKVRELIVFNARPAEIILGLVLLAGAGLKAHDINLFKSRLPIMGLLRSRVYCQLRPCPLYIP